MLRIKENAKIIVQFLLVFLLTTVLYLAGFFEAFEYDLMDTRFYLLPKRGATSDLILVDIDPKSLSALNEWPWPRSHYAKILKNLNDAGATKIVFDIDLSSNFSADGDDIFERALESSPITVALPIFKQDERNIDGIEKDNITKPLERFKKHASLVSINVHPEAIDGKIRRMLYFEQFPDANIPTIATYLANDTNKPFESFFIDYSINTASIPRLSYIDVLQGRFLPSQVMEKNIIIGATALELRDNVPVPLLHSLPGTILHALAYQSLIQDRALIRTSSLPTIFIALLLALLLMSYLKKCSWRAGLVMCTATAGTTVLLTCGIQFYFPVLVDSAPWFFVIILSYLIAIVGRIDKQALQLFSQTRTIDSKDVLMKNIVDNSLDGILTFSPQGIIASMNPAAENMFRHQEREAIGKHISILIPELNYKEHDGGDVEQQLMLQRGTLELEGRRKDNSTFPVEISITEMNVHEYHRYICSSRDITEHKQQTEALRYQALHDGLTDLPNRTLLHDRIDQSLRKGHRYKNGFALLLMDLDEFKDVNDTLGHHIGDLLLQQVAKRLTNLVRDTDTVARLGGDEFAMLISDITDTEQVRLIAEKTIQEIEKPVEINGLTLQVGISIGCVLFPNHGENVNTLLQRADVTMYYAKRDTMHFTMYDFARDHNSVRQLALRGELRHAIEHQELTLYCQPKVSLAKQCITSVEFLVRWQHPEHGFLPPDEFIPMAERTGLILPLTKWVFSKALQQCAAWRQENIDISVAINLSAKDLMDQQLPEMLEELLTSLTIDPTWLVLEITESNIMENPDAALNILNQLNEMGVKISVDDFGTGYSSLSYIKNLPLHELKIDKSFVLGMQDDKRNLSIVRSTVDLAHNLGLDVVAEGVETQQTVDLLTEFGCDAAQGYFFSHPLPLTELKSWLTVSPWGKKSLSDETQGQDTTENEGKNHGVTLAVNS